jgi:phosphotriesterase-related protein
MAGLVTTLGRRGADQLGMVLPHEHVFVDLRTWDQPGYAEADSAAVVALMAPEVERAQAAGVTAIVECSTVGVGRRADIDRAVSEATGLPLVVPTGIYREPWVPDWARRASEGELQEWMLKELGDEIAGTGVRAGWIKLSAGDDGLTSVEAKILRAAAGAAKETGCVIGSHTVRGIVVRNQLEILERLGVAPDRFVWIHTQAEPDVGMHLEMGRRGCWIEYDAIGSAEFDDQFFIERIERLLNAGLGGRLLLSQDRGSYDPALPGGGTPRAYTYLGERFLPRLQAAGVDEAEIIGLTHRNPFDAFAW